MKKCGGFIPDFRSERSTVEYLSYVLVHLLTVGSPYLALIAVLPDVTLDMGPGDTSAGTGSMFGGIALLTPVNITLTAVR